MGSTYEYQATATYRSEEMQRAAQRWQRADKALAATGRHGFFGFLFGRRTVA